jgi:hypothetical protein
MHPRAYASVNVLREKGSVRGGGLRSYFLVARSHQKQMRDELAIFSIWHVLQSPRPMLPVAQRLARRSPLAAFQTCSAPDSLLQRSMSKSALKGELTEFSVVYTGDAHTLSFVLA